MSSEIEYHIQFPGAGPQPDTKHPNGLEKYPIVFLLGWIGCKDKNLARYSNLYNDLGCITVRCCVPVSTLTMQHTKYPTIASGLLDLVTDMAVEDHPIFFHVFSNGGCYLYQYLVNQIQIKNLTLDVRGCVMDSAPGKIRMNSIFKSIMLLPVAIKPIRMILAAVACVWMWVLHGIMIFLNKTVDRAYLSGDVWNNLLQARSNIPQLFIYSEDDQLVHHEDIEEFIDGRKNRGVAITKCKFANSPHVMHLLSHREEYLDAINGFLSSCLL